MQLSPHQVRCLRLTQTLRRTGFSPGRVLLASWKAYLALFGATALINVACWWAGMLEPAWLVDGMVLGAVLRDIRNVRTQALLWPMSVEITDWERVAALIAANSSAPGPN